IAREVGNRYGEGAGLGGLGNIYYSLGQYDKAKQHLEQAFLILEAIKSPYAEIVRRNLAELEAR
ncbi:MAG: tetratricopeptide repeat protein, partial [Desulfobulbaceae bacterium]|nr:tetratricopeptide repeat protein [Desulfobulbaceae bacterium]